MLDGAVGLESRFVLEARKTAPFEFIMICVNELKVAECQHTLLNQGLYFINNGVMATPGFLQLLIL